ncbi:MAG: transposase [Planctomycetota bacterium]
MKGKRYTTEQMIRIAREGQRAGMTIADVCREHQISEHSYHRWKAELRMLEVDQAKQLRELRREIDLMMGCGTPV